VAQGARRPPRVPGGHGLDPWSNLPAGELVGAPGIARTRARALWNESIAGNLKVAAPLEIGRRSMAGDIAERRQKEAHGGAAQ
jgi:hypothetical protein